jgi:hypothetical protein
MLLILDNLHLGCSHTTAPTAVPAGINLMLHGADRQALHVHFFVSISRLVPLYLQALFVRYQMASTCRHAWYSEA